MLDATPAHNGPVPQASAQLRHLTTAGESLPARISLVSDPVRIRVRAASNWPARVLTDEFGPYLAPAPVGDAEGAEQVAVVTSSDLGSRLNAAQAEGFQLIRKIAGNPSARTVAHLAWHDENPSDSVIVLADASSGSERLLLRMVRAVAARMLLDAGWLPLHAACLVTTAGAVCLTGERGHGKTTALLQLLHAGGARTAFLANDKVFVSRGPGRPAVRALPVAAGIRQGTVQMFPQLTRLAGRAGELHCDNPTDAGASEYGQRLLVTPRQIAHAFHTTVSASAPLVGIIRLACPAGRSTVSPSCWKRLAPDQATDLWRSAYLRGWLPDDQYELARLDSPVPLLRRQHRQLVAALAGTIPAATFRPGADSAAALDQVVMSLCG